MDVLVNRHRSRVFAYAMRLSRDTSVAEDVVADTFYRAIRGASTYKGDSSFNTWLHTLAKNCYLDLRRKRLLRPPNALRCLSVNHQEAITARKGNCRAFTTVSVRPEPPTLSLMRSQ